MMQWGVKSYRCIMQRGVKSYPSIMHWNVKLVAGESSKKNNLGGVPKPLKKKSWKNHISGALGSNSNEKYL